MKRRNGMSTATRVTITATFIGVLAAAVSYSAALATSPLPAPTMSAKPANPTSSQSASFTYTDSQAVTKFQCQLDGTGFTDCGTTRPSTKSYPGPLAAGSHTFQVRAMSGTKTNPVTSYVWVIHPTPPPAPILDPPLPPAKTTATTITVLFHDTQPGVTFQCNVEGATNGWVTCASGQTFTVHGDGEHTFKVRAVDAAGVESAARCFTWTITVSKKGMRFTVNGDAIHKLYPGVTSPIDLVFTNPNTLPITVTGVTASISGTSDNAHCPVAGNFSIGRQLQVNVVVPASSTRSLSDLGVAQAGWPTVAMANRPVNQDGCQAKTVNLTYTGSAHS